MSRRAIALLVAAFVASVVLFAYGATWSIAHGGYWEDGSRPRALLNVDSEIPASIVRGHTTDDWLTDPDNWIEILPGDSIVITGSTRYCVVNHTVIAAGTTPPDDPADIDVLAELEPGRCFPTMRTLLTIDHNREIRFEEQPDPTEPVWGYFVFALSWLPFAATWTALRRGRLAERRRL